MFSSLPLHLKSNKHIPQFGNFDNVENPFRKGHVLYRHLISHFTT